MIKYLAFIFIIFAITSNSFGRGVNVDEVEVNCDCSKEEELLYKDHFSTAKNSYEDLDHLRATMRVLFAKDDFSKTTYQLFKKENEVNILKIEISLRERVKTVVVTLKRDYDISSLYKVIALKEGDYLTDSKIKSTLKVLKEHLKEKGFLNNSIKLNAGTHKSWVRLEYIVDVGDPVKIKDFDIVVGSKRVKTIIRKKFIDLIGENFDLVSIRERVDLARSEISDIGYYINSVEYICSKFLSDSEQVIPRIEIKLGKKYLFKFYKNKLYSRQNLLGVIRPSIIKYADNFNIDRLHKEIQGMYFSKGFLSVKVDTRLEQQGNTNYYFVNIDEGRRSRLKNLVFRGASRISADELEDLYFDKAYDLASRKYFDQKYFDDFPQILKTYYVERGHVAVRVGAPKVEHDYKHQKFNLEYRISERVRTNIKNFSVFGIDENLKKELLKDLKTKEGDPFNPIAFRQDLETLIQALRDRGYYYAYIKNFDSKNIVFYSDDLTQVRLKVHLDTGPIIKFRRPVIVGQKRTKMEVILREINFERGDIITKEKIQSTKAMLESLGIFSRVQVRPLKNSLREDEVDLLVEVNEKFSGYIEVAPGFRSDIGMKISGVIGHNNLWGMNRQVSFKGQLNQRLNYQTLDPRRREERKKVIEYNTKLNYVEPYLFKWPVSYGAAITNSQRRFYSFDANITRFENRIRKDLSRSISVSLKHQYETISQTDATDKANDEGHFEIGSFTPGMNFDFRNNPIVPTKGAFFGLSMELAKPIFLSQKEDDLEINYYKLISRNKFYVPVGDSFVLAMSVAAGQQRNLARDFYRNSSGQLQNNSDGVTRTIGYIPSIKVFRLNGIDVVRGYADDEINRLASGSDISDVVVQDEAYFTTFKFEPRYFVDDTTIFGIFFDAGRVSVNHYNPTDLRTSVGLSFKYLTPVGTLDFDYGHKLKRHRLANGKLEDAGRFHISIGFF